MLLTNSFLFSSQSSYMSLKRLNQTEKIKLILINSTLCAIDFLTNRWPMARLVKMVNNVERFI